MLLRLLIGLGGLLGMLSWMNFVIPPILNAPFNIHKLHNIPFAFLCISALMAVAWLTISLVNKSNITINLRKSFGAYSIWIFAGLALSLLAFWISLGKEPFVLSSALFSSETIAFVLLNIVIDLLSWLLFHPGFKQTAE